MPQMWPASNGRSGRSRWRSRRRPGPGHARVLLGEERLLRGVPGGGGAVARRRRGRTARAVRGGGAAETPSGFRTRGGLRAARAGASRSSCCSGGARIWSVGPPATVAGRGSICSGACATAGASALNGARGESPRPVVQRHAFRAGHRRLAGGGLRGTQLRSVAELDRVAHRCARAGRSGRPDSSRHCSGSAVSSLRAGSPTAARGGVRFGARCSSDWSSRRSSCCAARRVHACPGPVHRGHGGTRGGDVLVASVNCLGTCSAGVGCRMGWQAPCWTLRNRRRLAPSLLR